MDLLLKGRVALVTGAGQGVGRRICLELAGEGVAVAVNDLLAERATRVAEEIRDQGGSAVGVAADIRDSAAVEAMFAAAQAALGPIDILVNNAGVPPMRRDATAAAPFFLETSIEEQRQMLDINMTGTINCCRAALPGMVERHRGRIVSIVSEAGRVGEARLAVYSGAKAGVIGLTKALAREYGRFGIGVNAVALGAVAHEGIRSGATSVEATPQNDPRLAQMLKLYPMGQGLGRLGRPEDASAAVAFLASERAAFVTGQTLGVSGGYAMV
ncbi:MAG: SDR family NAD(P)-dependent oxidoreductase [Burkholderiaceae bacterium]